METYFGYSFDFQGQEPQVWFDERERLINSPEGQWCIRQYLSGALDIQYFIRVLPTRHVSMSLDYSSITPTPEEQAELLSLAHDLSADWDTVNTHFSPSYWETGEWATPSLMILGFFSWIPFFSLPVGDKMLLVEENFSKEIRVLFTYPHLVKTGRFINGDWLEL